MKKFAIILLVLALALTQGIAQSSKKKASSTKKKKKEEYSLKEHIWYGGSVLLGFSAQQGSSALQVGVAPMVGYKFTKWLSAGPRIAPTLIAVKETSLGRYNALDFEYSLFTRAKIINGIYGQAEYGGRLFKIGKFGDREHRFQTLVGGGISQSNGGWGSDVSILYNLQVARDLNNVRESPLVLRFGFSYNF